MCVPGKQRENSVFMEAHRRRSPDFRGWGFRRWGRGPRNAQGAAETSGEPSPQGLQAQRSDETSRRHGRLSWVRLGTPLARGEHLPGESCVPRGPSSAHPVGEATSYSLH